MRDNLKRICGNCGAEYQVGTRCPCFYIEMDRSLRKPLESDMSDPFRYFRTFLENRNPYCFLYLFYRTEGMRGYIDENNESIWFKSIAPDGTEFKEQKPFKYHEFVKRIFSRQLYLSQGFIDELIFNDENQNIDPDGTIKDLISQLKSIVKKEKKGAFLFAASNALGESYEIRNVFENIIQSLIEYLENKVLPTLSKAIKGPREKQTLLNLEDVVIGRYDELLQNDIELLCKLNYFRKNQEPNVLKGQEADLHEDQETNSYTFIGAIDDIVAITERWKSENWLKRVYCGYNKQSKISQMVYDNFNMTNLTKRSVNERFKKYILLDSITGRLNEEIEERIRIIDERIEQL